VTFHKKEKNLSWQLSCDVGFSVRKRRRKRSTEDEEGGNAITALARRFPTVFYASPHEDVILT
jgi:hypothetical protein